MAKIYGLFGTMTGKLADTVMSVRNGEQLARKYQPIVYNPSTPAQIATRAKMKLMSQLSAVMAPYIAIPREGTISSRNLFVKTNYGLATFENNKADINLNDIQLTKSVVGLPSVAAYRGTESIQANLNETGIVGLSRVVFVFFEKEGDDKLRAYASTVVEDPNPSGIYAATAPTTPNSVVVLAYGVRDNTENAHVKFGNLTAPTAEDVAKLLVSRVLTETDVTLTVTRGVTLNAAQQTSIHSVSAPADDENRSSKKS